MGSYALTLCDDIFFSVNILELIVSLNLLILSDLIYCNLLKALIFLTEHLFQIKYHISRRKYIKYKLSSLLLPILF